MTKHASRETEARYAVVPADGHYGDFADVVSTHGSRAAAMRAASGNWQVIECAAGTVKGDRIPRASVKS